MLCHLGRYRGGSLNKSSSLSAA